jgi:hypothetical protein
MVMHPTTKNNQAPEGSEYGDIRKKSSVLIGYSIWTQVKWKYLVKLTLMQLGNSCIYLYYFRVVLSLISISVRCKRGLTGINK